MDSSGLLLAANSVESDEPTNVSKNLHNIFEHTIISFEQQNERVRYSHKINWEQWFFPIVTGELFAAFEHFVWNDFVQYGWNKYVKTIFWAIDLKLSSFFHSCNMKIARNNFKYGRLAKRYR